MVVQKKKAKICDKVSHEEAEDLISKLPESLISEILYHLPTRDAVRTSALSTRWRQLWLSVPALDLSDYRLTNFDAFNSFVKKFIDSNTDSWIRKLRLRFYKRGMCECDLTSWIHAVTTRRIQHLDVDCDLAVEMQIPLSLYTCETLVHLRLCEVTMCNAEFVSLPCLKIMRLRHNKYPNNSTLQKLISGSPVLEDLTIFRYLDDDDKANALHVRSQTLKRAYISEFTEVVIDAPLLQCLNATVSSLPKNFQIVNLGSSARLDIASSHATCSSSMIHDILTAIPMVRELVISNGIWKDIFQFLKLGPLLQFRDLSRLNVQFSKSDLEMLPTLLDSCTKLESLVMKLVKEPYMRGNKKEPKVVFSSTVPQCLLSSLKFVEWKRSFVGYEGELELVRYFLKNSKVLEKFRVDTYYAEKAKCAFLQELLTMPRCSSFCELHCSLIAKNRFG